MPNAQWKFAKVKGKFVESWQIQRGSVFLSLFCKIFPTHKIFSCWRPMCILVGAKTLHFYLEICSNLFFDSWISYMYFGIQTFASKRESHLGKVNCGRATETLKCLQVKTREGDISASYRNRRKSNFVEKTAEKNTCLHCVTFVKIINMCQ